jgi:ABC-type branched-subunit amino acid transport system substrate-binding protein
MKRYSIVVLAVILIAALLIGGCSSQVSTPAATSGPAATSAAPQGPIKIGISGPSSGFWAFDVPYNITGAQMAVDAVNASGGVLGRKVELVIRDNQADPSKIVPESNALKEAGCVAIIGDFIDPDNYALSAWGEENKMPVFLQSSTSTLSTTNFKPYSFQSAPGAWAESNIMVDQVAKRNIKSVLFFNADVGFAYELTDFVTAGLKAKSPDTKILGSQLVGSEETDYSSALSAMLAKNPEMVINNVVSMNLVSQMQTFNFFQKTKVIGTYSADVVFTTPYGKKYPEGVEGITWYPFWLNEPAIQSFNKEFAAKANDKMVIMPSNHTIQFYTSVIAVCEAIKAAGGTDGTKMMKALETISYDTPIGKLKYGSYDHVMRFPLYWVSTKISSDYPIAVGDVIKKYITMGLTFVMIAIMEFIWGKAYKIVAMPEVLSFFIPIAGIDFPAYYIFIIAVSALFALGLWLMVDRTKLGMICRAIISDRSMVGHLGINVPFFCTVTFMVSVWLSGVAGAIMSPLISINSQNSVTTLFSIFVVLIVGGLTSMKGVFFSALLVGVINALGLMFLPWFYTLLPVTMMILVLLFKPEGLFERREN